MGIKFANNATGTLASSINNSVTTITLTAGQGGLFPSLAAGDYFYATLYNASNQIEIIKVTARSTDTLTVLRGQEGTTARSYAAGDRIDLRPTAASLSDIVTEATQTALPKAGGTMTGTLNVLAETSMNSGVADVLTVRGEDRTFRLRQTSGGLVFYDNTRNANAFGADSSGNLIGNGIVRQIVTSTYTGSVSTNSGAWINTGHSVTITPSSASNKILLLTTFKLFQTDEYQPSSNALVTIYRGATNLATGGQAWFIQNSSGYANSIYTGTSITYLDSPATTSAVTYTNFVRSAGGNANAVYEGFASFVAMEISQ